MSSIYYIGTSGWHYDHWRHRFYPGGLPGAKWLEFYAGHFTTVELNNSFYRLPSEEAFANWAKRLADLVANLREVYIYFNNDVEGFALSNATTLRGYLQREG